MKKVILVLFVCLFASMSHAGYYLKINGDTVGSDYTVTVGAPVLVEVWSDSVTPMSVEPTNASAFLEDAYNTILWNPDYSTPSEAFTGFLANTGIASWSATGWTNGAPYQNIVALGFSLGYAYGVPTAAGKWWEFSYTPLSEGDRILGLGSYDESSTEFRNAQSVTMHQVPEPATLSLLGLAGLFGLRRKKA